MMVVVEVVAVAAVVVHSTQYLYYRDITRKQIQYNYRTLTMIKQNMRTAIYLSMKLVGLLGNGTSHLPI